MNVILHSMGRYVELVRDFLIREAIHNQLDDLPFARRNRDITRAKHRVLALCA